MATSSLFLLMDQNTRTVAAQPEEMKIMNPVIIAGEPNLPKLQQSFQRNTETSCCERYQQRKLTIMAI